MKFSPRLLAVVILFEVLPGCKKDGNQNATAVNQSINPTLAIKVIGSEREGWGYEIYKGNKAFIKQTIIPAIGGKKKFISEEEATRVAALVVKKLSSRNGLPTITLEELDSLKITY